MTVQLDPITRSAIPAVAHFLHNNLNSRVSSVTWQRALEVPWQVDSPNHGFMLMDNGRVVGAYVAYYSDRIIHGQKERFCNLGAWCVLEQYRFQGVRLLKSLLSQGGFHFTDLSPSGNVVALNERLKFKTLDATMALVPNLPWPPLPGRCHLTADSEALLSALTGRELRIYRDHQNAGAAQHLLLLSGTDSCYIVYRKDARKNLRLFVSVLHVSNPALLKRHLRQVCRYFLFHHAAVATLLEIRVLGSPPQIPCVLTTSRPKMFRSETLDERNIDYLYSELTCLPW